MASATWHRVGLLRSMDTFQTPSWNFPQRASRPRLPQQGSLQAHTSRAEPGVSPGRTFHEGNSVQTGERRTLVWMKIPTATALPQSGKTGSDPHPVTRAHLDHPLGRPWDLQFGFGVEPLAACPVLYLGLSLHRFRILLSSRGTVLYLLLY